MFLNFKNAKKFAENTNVLEDNNIFSLFEIFLMILSL